MYRAHNPNSNQARECRPPICTERPDPFRDGIVRLASDVDGTPGNDVLASMYQGVYPDFQDRRYRGRAEIPRKRETAGRDTVVVSFGQGDCPDLQ